jgi:hypothetical protein
MRSFELNRASSMLQRRSARCVSGARPELSSPGTVPARRRWPGVRINRARSILLLMIGGFLLAMNATHADTPPRTLEADASDYQSILEAARPPVRSALGIPVELKIEQLRSSGDWAFLLAQMRAPGGNRLDLSGTPYAEHAEAGSFSDAYAALFKRKDDDWTVVATAVGPGDPAWVNWSAEHGAPAALIQGQ